MKKRQLSLILALLLSACVPPAEITPTLIQEHSISPQETRTPNPIIRLTNGEWAPYTSEKIPGYGCDSLVISEVFSHIGYSVEFGFFPWARAMQEAKSGKWDGTVEWDDLIEFREDFYISTNPISTQEWVFFFRKDRPFEWNSLDDITDEVIGITRSYEYSDAFITLIKEGKLQIDEASSDEANFRKLLAGRIDIFPMEHNVGLALLKNNFSNEERGQITHNPRALSIFQPRLLLSKTNPDNKRIMDLFDKELGSLKQSPMYLELMKNCQY